MVISAAERAYVADGCAQNHRADGRARADHRAFALALNAVPSAAGSAAVALGHGASATRCVCAVRADVTTPSREAPDEGRVVVRVDASAIGGEGGRGRTGRHAREAAENLSLRYARMLESVLLGREARARDGYEEEDGEDGVPSASGSGGLDLKALCVRPGKACWTLAVDVTCACDRGSMLDALSVAVRAALADAKIPKVTIAGVGSDGEGGELEIDDDPDECSRVDMSRCGVVVTTTKIGRHGVIDATDEEEECGEASMSVGVDRDGMMCGEFGVGGENLDRGTAIAMRLLACRVGAELIEKMDACLTTAIASGDEDLDEDEDDRVMVVRLPSKRSM